MKAHVKIGESLLKEVLKGKFMALNAYVRKSEKTLINCLNSHFKNLDREDWNKHKSGRRKEIINMRGGISEIKNRKMRENINKSLLKKSIKLSNI